MLKGNNPLIVCRFAYYDCFPYLSIIYFFQNAHQKIARTELQNVMLRGKVDDVTKAVEKCLKAKIEPHDDEVTAGKARIEFLQMKKGILVRQYLFQIKCKEEHNFLHY